MKKLFCIFICLILIFSSINFCFATPVSWDSSDSQHLTEIRNAFVSGGTIYNLINAINSNLNLIDSHLSLIYDVLDPSSSSSTASILNKILSMISYSDAAGALRSWLVDIEDENYQQNLKLKDLRDTFYNYYLNNSSLSADIRRHNSHTQWVNQYGNYSLPNLSGDFSYTYTTHAFQDGSPLGNIGMMIYRLTNNQGLTGYRTLFGFNASQSALNWTTLSNTTFTPDSQTQGLYRWLSYIQAPVARLSYVLASDERIEAQEAAAANEEAVVDNFIDSSGDGSASTSDFSSISDLSSGYKQNFGSDASPSGIFDIFNADHASWFSQETKNQLDTTTPIRSTKGYTSDTPLLDKQIEDIYNSLGVKQP